MLRYGTPAGELLCDGGGGVAACIQDACARVLRRCGRRAMRTCCVCSK